MTRRPDLILASGSATRRTMLRAAGVDLEVLSASIDEAEARRQLVANKASITPVEIAEELAVAKAEDVSRLRRDAFVIGSDQVLELDGEILTKPTDIAGVYATLEKLNGKTHALHSAVALARGGATVWSICDTARLTMRTLSPDFVDAYVARVGEAVCQSVGAYQIEDFGIQLFERIKGDHFTILGMPLLPLLNELRARGVVAA